MTFAKTSIFALAVVAGTFSLAAAAGQSSSQVSALQRADRRVGRFAAFAKGGAQQRLLLERQRIRGLIDDLDSGKPVDPRDIDRALQRSQNPF